MAKHVGVLGSGIVGLALAQGFKKYGSDVAIGSHDGHKVEGWDGDVGTFKDVAEKSDILVLAVKGTKAEDLVQRLADQLAGKIIIDVTNPIADLPPVGGVLKYFTSLDESLMERLQKAVPKARFVKAFNSIGSAYMVDPDFGDTPSMFICGDDAGAKKEVTESLKQCGCEAEDMGEVQAARAIEPLCMLWCIPGIASGDWSPRAFKFLKK